MVFTTACFETVLYIYNAMVMHKTDIMTLTWFRFWCGMQANSATIEMHLVPESGS
jgi:hypothetical protein